jgi:GT2 family glycosyltransferase
MKKSTLPKITINILTWNAAKYLKPCLDAALNQDYENFEILIIDNNSQDNTVKILKKYLQKNSKKIRFLKNNRNVGFAAGHNRGIQETDGKYVMLLNQDAILTKSFLSQAVQIMEKDSQIAALQPQVLKYDFNKNKPKNIFDTTGLVMLRNRRIINRGQGQQKNNQYNKKEEIFGADGAVPIYRRKALEDVSLPSFQKKNHFKNEIFDENFFAYKEDVDLAWRLRLYGWKAVYAPQVVAYHERGAGESASRKAFDIIKERRNISLFSKTLSFKNQRLMQVKNEILGLYLKHLPWILWKGIRAWGYVLIFEPAILKILPTLFRQLPKALKQRKVINKRKKVPIKDLEKWFLK